MSTTKKRSVRSDSLAGAMSAFDAAISPVLQPPAHIKLRDGDWAFWEAIIRARARDTWNDVDLAKAANLARTQADIERLQIEIEEDGDTITNSRGTKVVNPKHTLLETLTRREIALSRTIHVHAEATVGRSEDAAKKLAEETTARESLDAIQDDGLIPGISHAGHSLQ